MSNDKEYRQPYENLGYLLSSRQIVEKVLRRYPKIKRVKDLKRFELQRLDTVYNIIEHELSKIVRCMPDLNKTPRFYLELLFTIIDENEFTSCIKKIRKYRGVIRNLWSIYRRRMLSENRSFRISALRRECVGRILSIVKRKLKCIDKIVNAMSHARTFPSIDPLKPTIIVAGMPQVGKSTLVSTLSSAKPKIAPYPFTTKNIIVGHLKSGKLVVQIIDTPGLLDRPLHERNPIEQRAIAALEHLPGIILYLIDVSKLRIYSLQEQIHVLKDIMASFQKKELFVAINKIDVTSKEDVEKALQELRRLRVEKIYIISAKTGYGIRVMLDDLLKFLREHSFNASSS